MSGVQSFGHILEVLFYTPVKGVPGNNRDVLVRSEEFPFFFCGKVSFGSILLVKKFNTGQLFTLPKNNVTTVLMLFKDLRSSWSVSFCLYKVLNKFTHME